jgi:hypothetical protein
MLPITSFFSASKMLIEEFYPVFDMLDKPHHQVLALRTIDMMT